MGSKGIALVTGAASGIGRAIALRLADDGFGIVLNDLKTNKQQLDTLTGEITRKGGKSLVTFGDASLEADVKGMVDSAVQNLGQLDVMVANAGILIDKPFIETTVEDWDRLHSINARGVFLCYRYAAEQMIKQGRGGRIIGASSVAGKQGHLSSAVYSASKFAVRGLTQAASKELGPHKITVNAYAPGVIDTPLLKFIQGAAGGLDAIREKWSNETAVGYLGKPEDIASIVSYLASEEAHFITGQSVSVNGGLFFD